MKKKRFKWNEMKTYYCSLDRPGGVLWRIRDSSTDLHQNARWGWRRASCWWVRCTVRSTSCLWKSHLACQGSEGTCRRNVGRGRRWATIPNLFGSGCRSCRWYVWFGPNDLCPWRVVCAKRAPRGCSRPPRYRLRLCTRRQVGRLRGHGTSGWQPIIIKFYKTNHSKTHQMTNESDAMLNE